MDSSLSDTSIHQGYEDYQDYPDYQSTHTQSANAASDLYQSYSSGHFGSVASSLQPEQVTPSPMTEGKQEHLLAQHLTSQPFTVRIGKTPYSQSTFHLPCSLLAARSTYFATLINGSFKGVEAISNTVTLDEEVDRVDAFEMFVDWLFLGDYNAQVPNRRDTDKDICLLHAQVYVLAERLCADGLKAVAVKKMAAQLHKAYAAHGSGPTPTWIPTISSSTIVMLVKTVYPYTSDAYQEEGLESAHNQATSVGWTAPVHPSHRDPMRVLIARYAGSALESLQNNSEFSRLMRGYYGGCAEFVNDLIIGVKKGDRVGLL